MTEARDLTRNDMLLMTWSRASVVEHAEDLKDLVLADALRALVESVERRVDHVDEFVGGVAVLQAAADSVVVHLGNERLELVAGEHAVVVGIGRGEFSVDFSLELNALLVAGAELFGVARARFLLFLGERVLPGGLVLLQGREESLQAGHLLLLQLLRGLLLNHLDLRRG